MEKGEETARRPSSAFTPNCPHFATVHPVVPPLVAVVTALAAPVPEPGHTDGPGTTYVVAVMAAAASMLKLMPGSLAL